MAASSRPGEDRPAGAPAAAGNGARRVRLALVLVGVGWLAAQLLVCSPHRPPSWDEAIYLSQVRPPALPFAASRSRGIVALAAPVVAAGGSIFQVRVWLAVASALALVAAFWPWTEAVGWPAPLAAFFFAGSWPGLLYGSEVMPNLWVALAAVAASGWALPGLRGSRRARDVGLAGALVAVAATFRPPDAALLAAPVLVALLVARAPRRWLVAITAGVAIGWLPWVIEMSLRFGGPLAALRAASALSHVGSAGVLERVRQYLSLGDGPLLGPATGAAVSRSVVVWSVLAAALAVTGLATARGSRRRPVLLAAAVGGVLGGEYLLLVTETAPRFLLPAGALLAIPAAAGLVELIRLGGRPALAVAAGAIVAWAVWQAGTALRVERQAASGREVAREVGVAVRSAAAGRPCAVASTEAYPEIGFAAGCEAQDLRAPDSGAWLASRVARGWATFVVAKTPEPEIAGARPVPAPKGWYAFELSPAP